MVEYCTILIPTQLCNHAIHQLTIIITVIIIVSIEKKNYQTHTRQMYSNHKVLSHKMHTTNTNLHHNCITMWHFIIIIIIIAMINLVNIHGKIADIRRRVGLFIFKYDELADAELFFCSLWSGKLFFETQCITQSKTVIC